MRILEAENLDIHFSSSSSGKRIHAVRDVSLYLNKGEFLGLVGESGCGKSTVARALAGLIKPDHGRIFLKGEELPSPYPRSVYQFIQMVFQLPQDSFDPRRTIESCITDIQVNFGVKRPEAKKRAARYLEQTGLDESFLRKYPHQMSGGECQRAAISRAIAVQPDVLICDEITSALDVSVQAQIVELLRKLKTELGLAALFISHDLALVRGLCDRVLVMNDGQIVEDGSVCQVMEQPREEYTKFLLDSVLEIGRG